jgi:hypothetical protein
VVTSLCVTQTQRRRQAWKRGGVGERGECYFHSRASGTTFRSVGLVAKYSSRRAPACSRSASDTIIALKHRAGLVAGDLHLPGKASAYLPVIDLLQSYFKIISEDDQRPRGAKVIGNVLTLDRTFEDTLPYLFALLGIGEGEELPAGIQFCRMAASILTQQTGFPC